MYRCENCNDVHEKNYGAGRFCSQKCARGFSTKEKRKEINYNVSLKLSGVNSNKIYKKETLEIVKICEICGIEFKKNKSKTCSRRCSSILGAQKQIGKRKIGNYKNNGGLREGGGKCIQLIHTNWMGVSNKLNREEIIIAEIMDSMKIEWERNWNGFLYEAKDKSFRKFYPDFYLKKFNIYVEYKGWITDEMRHKMVDSKERNEINLVIVVGNNKRYKNDGLNLTEFKYFLESF